MHSTVKVRAGIPLRVRGDAQSVRQQGVVWNPMLQGGQSALHRLANALVMMVTALVRAIATITASTEPYALRSTSLRGAPAPTYQAFATLTSLLRMLPTEFYALMPVPAGSQRTYRAPNAPRWIMVGAKLSF